MSKTIKVMRQALEVLKTLKVTEGYDQYKDTQVAIAALDEAIKDYAKRTDDMLISQAELLHDQEYELQVAEEVLYQRTVKAANAISAEVAGSTLVINSLKQSLQAQRVSGPQELEPCYINRLIEALYENSDPVSVEAAEEFQRMLENYELSEDCVCATKSAAEIEQLKAELQRVYTVVTSHAKITFKAEDERDQLKVKNDKLVGALNATVQVHIDALPIIGAYMESLGITKTWKELCDITDMLIEELKENA